MESEAAGQVAGLGRGVVDAGRLRRMPCHRCGVTVAGREATNLGGVTMRVVNILTINLLLSTFVFWIAARIYLIPKLRQLEASAVVLPVLLLHAMRHLGLMFLAPGAVYHGMPREFAAPAAYGDLLSAALALIAIAAVTGKSRLARPLVALFNIEGTLDLIVAITLATMYDAAPFMGPAYWIPAFWVPALLVTHYIVFLLLGRRWVGRM